MSKTGPYTWLDWVLVLICCWKDLLAGKACFVYNVIFSPCVLCFHAWRIYLCSCVFVYCRRFYYKICCFVCRSKNVCWLYTDRSFPAGDSTLGKIGGDAANKESGRKDVGTVWLRASCFAEAKDIRLFGPKVDACDICQGALGDCWLLAAMACMAEHDGAVHALFRTREYNPQGKYRLRLYDGQKERWRTVVVDDLIPCDADAYDKDGSCRPLFSQARKNEVWVVILEKAFAKFCGSYARLEGGLTTWALRAMTGDPAREFSREKGAWKRFDLINFDDAKDKRKCGLRKRDESISDDSMFEILKKYYKLGSVMSVSGAKEINGLRSGHAYSIMQVVVKKKFRLVQIRNPWGTGEWTGAWGDKSPLWKQHPDVRKALNFEEANDGAFWMGYEDFKNVWSKVGIVDRTVDIHTLKIQVRDHSSFWAPLQACIRGCGYFWCLCQGIKRLYCPHRTSNETVSVSRDWLWCFRTRYRRASLDGDGTELGRATAKE